jgi:hypothetical protein
MEWFKTFILPEQIDRTGGMFLNLFNLGFFYQLNGVLKLKKGLAY